jgi:hypothetical protein
VIAANQPIVSQPGQRGHADETVRPPWSDRHYLYPHASQPAQQQPASGPWTQAGHGPADELVYPAAINGHDHASAQAVIGDQLRVPAVWCEYGSCISRFADSAALGESDIKSRALAAGWRQDAVGRLACPTCLQHDPTFQTSYPLVPRQARPAPAATPLAAEPLPLESLPLKPLPAEPPAAEPLPEPAEISWASYQPRLQLALTTDEPPSRSAWFRHRESGRHRLTI